MPFHFDISRILETWNIPMFLNLANDWNGAKRWNV
jgi:hypothetical protein